MATSKGKTTRVRAAARRATKAAPARKKAAGQSPSESIIVYVHGIGRHAPSDELKLEWDLALFGRDLGARSRMAYWSDLLHPVGAIGAKSLRRRSTGDDSSLDVDSLLANAGVGSADENAQAFALALLREYGVEEAPARRGTGKKVLPLPGFMRKPISRAFLEAFVSDTAAYFFRAGMREKIQQRLVEQLRLPKGQPVTLVAHSQGTIIAYEVLSAMKKGALQLDALVTLGSPLGVREVQDFLLPDTREIPELVERWNNFSDPLDPVALDKGLDSDFAAKPPSTTSIEDEVIVNSNSRTMRGFNPHSAVGYLAHPSVRRVVNDAMRMDSLARFVVARDVAEGLGVESDIRQSVLIEVLEPGYGALDESTEAMRALELDERSRLRRGTDDVELPPLRLEHRIDGAARKLRDLLLASGGRTAVEAAQIDPLRRFVAAQLTAAELRLVGRLHRDLRVYAIWKSTRKAKMTDRSMRAIKADAALASFSASGRGITWAVLDTGIQANHPHFQGVIDSVWDCTRRGPPRLLVNAVDRDGHGTHVAGIVSGRAARLPGGQQPAERGVAPLTRLVVYKVLDDKGQGEDAWIIKALDHIAAQNENVTDGLAIHGLNLSLGGPFDNTVYGCGFSPICAELRRLWRNGVLVVVSCGNEGTLEVTTPDGEAEINSVMSIGDPANLEECIAVGSVNADRPHLYGISSFSSRGPTADGRAKPDVVAPGERISSCNARFNGTRERYYRESGTSMAAPHVSGLLAAFLSVRREFRGRPDEVKRILLSTCNDLGRDRYHQGRGMPNLMQMLLAV